MRVFLVFSVSNIRDTSRCLGSTLEINLIFFGLVADPESRRFSRYVNFLLHGEL